MDFCRLWKAKLSLYGILDVWHKLWAMCLFALSQHHCTASQESSAVLSRESGPWLNTQRSASALVQFHLFGEGGKRIYWGFATTATQGCNSFSFSAVALLLQPGVNWVWTMFYAWLSSRPPSLGDPGNDAGRLYDPQQNYSRQAADSSQHWQSGGAVLAALSLS